MNFKSFPLALAVIAGWTLLLALLLAWNIHREREQIDTLARVEAKANFNKDLTFRRWATGHGGIYVPISEKQQPVPWLKRLPERDVTTSGGRRLTLLNPASMLRQMMTEHAEAYGIRGRITGLKYLNPANAPDEWESAQLRAFESGERFEAWEVAEIGGESHLRYFQAMYMEEGCIKCHAVLGYTQAGEVRGGIGINVPMAPYLSLFEKARRELALSYGAIWLIGLAGIAGTDRVFRRRLLERERLTQERAESEERLRLVMEATADGIWDYDPVTRRTFFSANFVALLGYGSREAMRQTFQLGEALHAEDRERVLQAQQRSLEEGAAFDETYRLQRADGNYRWFHGRGMTVRDGNGRPSRFIGALADIDRLKQGERQIVELNSTLEARVRLRTAELETALRELEDFSYAASHDLRGPLRAVDGFAQIVGEEYASRLDDTAQGYLERIRQAGRHLSGVIDNMIELMRVTRTGLEPAEVDLSDLARCLLAELQARDGRAVVIRVADGLVARADADLIAVALRNLLHNAWKFTGGTPGACIDFGAADRDGERVFHVADNGAGFDPAYAGRLFRPFFRLHRPGEFPGAGIGLAVAKRIVGRHGGRLWATAAPGQGATFYFTLGGEKSVPAGRREA